MPLSGSLITYMLHQHIIQYFFKRIMYLGFLEGLEEGWGDFAGLVVGDGVVGGG